jgi:hypothetical protein
MQRIYALLGADQRYLINQMQGVPMIYTSVKKAKEAKEMCNNLFGSPLKQEQIPVRVVELMIKEIV